MSWFTLLSGTAFSRISTLCSPTLATEPANPGWTTFLDAYNRFCRGHGGNNWLLNGHFRDMLSEADAAAR